MNGLFLCTLYLSLWQPNGWLAWVVISFVWFVLAIDLVAFIARRTIKFKQPTPSWLGYLVDVLALYAMVRNRWYITVCAYVAGAILLFLVYRNAEDQQ